jgi:hypothetical protein
MRQHKTTTKPEPKKLTTPHRKPGIVAVAGLIMHLRLVSGRGGSLLAEHYTKDIKKALEAIDKLKTAGFRPNIIKSGAGYSSLHLHHGPSKACRRRRNHQKSHSALPHRKGEERHAEAEGNRRKDPKETSLFSISQRLSASLKLPSL